MQTIELCAGAGGAALGLEAAGFKPTALIEINPHCCATLRHNRPYWNVIEADINRLDASYWKGVDLVAGGLPCPPFSIAGKQLGSDDERDLFSAMLRIVKEVQPRAVMIENVRGILTSRFAEYRKRIDARLRKMGFISNWAMFDAANFMVPQKRSRVFLIALRKNETAPLEWPNSLNPIPPTVGDTLHDLMAKNGWRKADDWAKKANRIAPTIVGGSWKHGGPDLGPTRARAEWAKMGVDGLGIANEEPCVDFEGMPRLTIGMVKRLQDFPDDWQLMGGKTQAYRQVGNALPVGLAHAIAKATMKCLS